MIADARREPREELFERAFVIGPDLGEFFAGDLNVEVLRARQAQRGLGVRS